MSIRGKICPVCNKNKKLTRHHILPKRFFGKKKYRKEILMVCRKCHDRIEMNIPRGPLRIQSDKFYYRVLNLVGVFVEPTLRIP